jgi:hypothetical protein
VIDSYAQVDLLQGTVVAAGMYGDAPELAADEDLVGLDLDPSQFPKSIHPGDSVVVVLSAAEGSTPILLSDGTVRAIKGAETGGGSTVDVVISNQCSDQMATGSSHGDVSLVEVAPNARAITCASPDQVAKLPKGNP